MSDASLFAVGLLAAGPVRGVTGVIIAAVIVAVFLVARIARGRRR